MSALPAAPAEYVVIRSASGRMVVTAYPEPQDNVIKRGFPSPWEALEWARVEHVTGSSLRAANGRDYTGAATAIGWLIVIGLMAFCLYRGLLD